MTASSSPRRRPLSRSRPRAVGSPASAAATRSRTCWMSSLPAWPTSAQPPATASRQPGPAAPAGQALGGGGAGVADLAGRADVALDQPSVGDDAEPEAGRGLHDQGVPQHGAAGQQLGLGEHVGVVGHHQGGVGQRREERAELDAVPAGDDGGVDARAADLVDGAGEAEADREQRGLPARELAGGALHDPRHQLGGSGAGGVVDGVGGQLLAAQVEDADLAAGPADRDRQHHAGVRVDGEGGRGAAAGRGQLLAGQQQAAGDQRGDPGGDRGAGEAGQPAEVGAGGRPAAADEVEDHAGGRSGGCAELAVGLHAVCSSPRRTSVAGYVHVTLI